MRNPTAPTKSVIPMTRDQSRKYRAAARTLPVAISPQANVHSSMNATEPMKMRA